MKLRAKLVSIKADKIESMRDRWAQLDKKKDAGGLLTAEEEYDLRYLDWKLHYVPDTKEELMPTKLGNTLRAAELNSADNYGLDAIVCWRRLWLLLPEDVKKELTDARADLDMGVRVFIWGGLFLIWLIWAPAWWIFLILLALSISAVTFSYFFMMIGAAEIYGSLLESTFDLYRSSLYKSLRWPSPSKPSEEKSSGESLTAYLWRGLSDDDQVFTEAETKPPSPPSHTTIIVEAPEVMRELRRLITHH